MFRLKLQRTKIIPRVNIHWLFNPIHREVNNLRGLQALRTLAHPSMLGETIDLLEPVINESDKSSSNILFMTPGIIFADLAAVVDSSLLYNKGVVSRLPLILDVHFPILHPKYILGANSSGEFDLEHSEEIQRWWTEPTRFSAGTRLVAKADMVTVPYEKWMIDVLPFNPNVVVLPDVKDATSAVTYCRTFIKTMSQATLNYLDLGFYGRALGNLSISLQMARYRHKTRALREKFEALNWDN